MSLKTPSCTTNRVNLDRQWDEIKTKFIQTHSAHLPNEPTDRVKQAKIISLLEAAMALKSKYIETLHVGLVTFLGDLTNDMLHHYANYFLRNVQYQESRLNTDYVPTAIKKISLTLQSLEEVKDSKDYKAIFDRYIAGKEATKSDGPNMSMRLITSHDSDLKNVFSPSFANCSTPPQEDSRPEPEHIHPTPNKKW